MAIAAIIPVLIRPVLGRMFTPEEFNMVGLFVTISSILAIAANLRYGYAVAVTRTDREALAVLAGSIFLSLIFSIFVTGVILLFGKSLLFFLEESESGSFLSWLLFVPVSTFAISACIGFNGWLNRQKAFRGMAYNKILRRGSEGAIQLGSGKLSVNGGLILGTLLGDVINLIVHFFQFKKTGGTFKNIKRSEITSTLSTYSDFPKYNLLPALLDTLTLALPFLIINNRYSAELSGQFAQSRDLLSMPLVLISATISQVLLQRLVEQRNRNAAITPIVSKHLVYLGAMGLVGGVILFFFGEPLFLLFVGDQWGPAGQMATWMVIAFVLKFTISPLSVLFFAIERVKIASVWQLFYFTATTVLFLLPDDVGIYEFICWYVVIDAITYLVYLILIYREAKHFDAKTSELDE